MRDTLLRLEQHSDGSDLVLCVSGRLVDHWPETEREIWRAPESTIRRLNLQRSESLDKLLERLRNAETCDPRRSELYFAEYVRSAHKYWSKSEADTDEHVLRRERLNDLLAPYAAQVGSLARDDPLSGAGVAPVIEIISTVSAPIPYELLPMGQRPQVGETLWDSCLHLPAFSSIVRHMYYRRRVDAETHGRALLPDTTQYRGELRAFLRSRDTKLWRRMDEYFATEEPRRVWGAAPTRDVLEDREGVANYLLNPWPLPTAPAGERSVSDIHVYAHGVIGKGSEEGFSIRFEYRHGISLKVVEVRSIDFDDAFAIAESQGPGHKRPLIWFNCCDAAGAVGEELFSVSVELANLGCAVIAPRTATPEGFATALAQDFYKYLRFHEVPSEAFLAARLESIRTRDNPLGVVYMALGNVA